MARVTTPLFLLLLAALPALAEDGKPQSPKQAADAVLAAAKDAKALETLASRDTPDPWLVADELIARGEEDAAIAFARAKPRVDVEKLPDYIDAMREYDPEDKEREAYAATENALRSRALSKALVLTEDTAGTESVIGIRLLHARALALRMMRRSEDADKTFRKAADAARAMGWLARAARLYQEGGLASVDRFAWPNAIATWEVGLEVAKQRNDQEGIGRVQNNIGLAMQQMGKLDEALVRYEQALAIAEQSKLEKLAAMVLGNVGIIHELRGDFRKALETYQRAQKQMQRLGAKRNESVALSNIGAVYDSLGNFKKALGVYKRSLAIREELGDKQMIAQALGDIGSALHGLGDYAKALSTYERALEQAQALGDGKEAARTLGNLAGVYLELGDEETALAMGERALKLKEEMGDAIGAAITLGNVGLMYSSRGDMEAALDAYQRARVKLEELGREPSVAALLGNIGSTQFLMGDYEKALATLTDALARYQKMGNRGSETSTLTMIGRTLRAMGDNDAAREAFKKSERLARRLRARFMHVAVLAALADLHLAEDDTAEALRAAQRALDAMEGLLGGLGEEQGAMAREMHARLFEVGTLAAIREDDLAEALTFIESGRAGALLDALGKREEMRWKAESLSPELRQADQDAQAAERNARRRYDAAVRGGKLPERREAGKALDAASDALRNVAGRIQRELKQQAGLYYPRAETIEAIQDALADDQALVLYTLCRGEALAFRAAQRR